MTECAAPAQQASNASGADALNRSGWARTDPLLRDYYDTEWGEIVTAEDALFERLTLECFQAGLSWVTILRKRAAFREAFSGFNPDVVAAYDDSDVVRLLSNAGIIRNRAKIASTIVNAQSIVQLRRAPLTFPELVWSFLPERLPAPTVDSEIPTTSPESVALARALKSHGFRFVGPTNMYALMSAIGMVDTHTVSSFRRGCSGLWEKDGSRSSEPPPVLRGIATNRCGSVAER